MGFVRPFKPMPNEDLDGFTGCLRDVCLNGHFEHVEDHRETFNASRRDSITKRLSTSFGGTNTGLVRHRRVNSRTHRLGYRSHGQATRSGPAALGLDGRARWV
jgi:hypothetical protein